VKASTRKTSQSSSIFLSDSQAKQPISTTQRLSTFRRDYFIRNYHRYIISRKFDWHEAVKKFKKDGEKIKNDDDLLLKDESERSEHFKVIYILPHSLISFITVGG
jgi:hypothetical protein